MAVEPTIVTVGVTGSVAAATVIDPDAAIV